MTGRVVFLIVGMTLLVRLADAAGKDGVGIQPDDALQRLQDGNARFVAQTPAHPHTDLSRLAETATRGQHPFATVIGCSDSRVPVERIFDQGVGDVFVIRVAGNVCDTDEIGSIEYGVDHLGTPIMVVLGHTQCGAVTAVTTGAELDGSIPALVAEIQPAVAAARAQHRHLDDEALVPHAIEANVWQAIDDLFRKSPATRKRVAAGTLKVVGGIYDLSSGSVQWLGEHPAQPKLLAYNSGGAHSDAGHAAVAKHGRTEAADAAPIELVPAARLSELDQARSAKPHVEVPHYPPNTHNSLNLLLLVVGVIAGAFGLVSWKTGLFQQLGIRGKLYSGFAAVVLLAVAIGGVGYTSLSQVSEKAAESLLAVNMEFYASEARALQNRFILEGIADHERGEEILAEHAHTLERVHVLLDEFESLPLDEVARGASGELAKETQHYEEVFTELVHYFHEIEQLKKLLTATGKELDQGLVELIHQHEAELAELEQNGANSQDLIVTTQLVETLLEAEVLAAKIAQAETEFLLTKHLATVAAIEQLFGTFYARIDRAIALEVAAAGGETGGAEVQHLRKLREKALGYQEATAKIVIDELLVGGEMVTCDAALGHFSQEAEAIATRAQAEAAAYKASAARTSIMMVVVAALVGSLLSFFISRGITKPVQIAISGLTAGSDHVRVAAGQVSTASQSLAETSTEQASSLEETSSALEELTAMTRQNAENSGKASHLAETARNNAASGDQTMHQLNGAMNAINESSGEISKIIKVIEEIAFQTNLLALNAAVEAARAGEHGKGFAVVADEVRSLALRAAEAARDTTGLIEQSVARAQEGTSVAASAGSVLQSIVGDVTQIADLLGGINTASNEQARGVDQINSAVSQIDQVTQTNAASAEESASAAEELSAQATQLNSIVDSLVTIVSGGKSRPSV